MTDPTPGAAAWLDVTVVHAVVEVGDDGQPINPDGAHIETRSHLWTGYTAADLLAHWARRLADCGADHQTRRHGAPAWIVHWYRDERERTEILTFRNHESDTQPCLI